MDFVVADGRSWQLFLSDAALQTHYNTQQIQQCLKYQLLFYFYASEGRLYKLLALFVLIHCLFFCYRPGVCCSIYYGINKERKKEIPHTEVTKTPLLTELKRMKEHIRTYRSTTALLLGNSLKYTSVESSLQRISGNFWLISDTHKQY